MMTANEYKAALAALAWNHDQAAQALGIGRRTSQRYAKEGAPKFIALALKAALLGGLAA
jgi:DNA-binding Xre family transcriptional regulator